MLKKKISIAFITLLFISFPIFAQSIRDIIPPVKIVADKADTVLISDLFYAPNYQLSFLPNTTLSVSYSAENKLLIIAAKPEFKGFSFLEFKLGKETYAIPVQAKSFGQNLISHTFTLKPDGKVDKVSLVGSFNNWKRDANPMSFDGSAYTTTLQLEPGSYVYKFIADGKEVLDPLNPERAPTGFENFNSVLRVIDPNQTLLFLHKDDFNSAPQKAIFGFELTTNDVPANIDAKGLFALLDNSVVPASAIQVHGSHADITISSTKLSGEKLLRVIAVKDGNLSNLQSIFIRNGKPVDAHHKSFAWEDGIIYSIMVDRFNDGDKSNSIPVVHDSLFPQANYNGGDFQGIINKIDDGYFDALGINVLWISPVYDNPNVAYREYPEPHRWYSGYHGYWPISATNVEEKFGTMAKLQELVEKAHKHGFKVLLDIVAHHVHIMHPFYKDHPDWFGKLDLPDGRKNLRLWDEYRLTTWFEPYMPSFDYTSSKDAVDTMSSNCVWWLNQTHADGFRHDAVKHVPNLFWRALTKKLKEEIEIPQHKKVYQIGETFGDNDLIASYVNNGQLSAQFNFNLSYLSIPIFLEKGKSFQTLDYYMSKTFASFGYNHIMGNIMDSHDKVRFMAYADGKVGAQGVDTREMAWNHPPTVDHPESYDKAKLYYAFMFTTPGLPTIYYGSEFGMTGADDPDNRRMMRFGNDLTDNEKHMLGETQKIVKIRNDHSALRYGDFYTLAADNDTYSFLRSDFNERVLVILNKAESEKTVTLTIPASYHAKSAVDVLTGEKIAVEGNKVTLSVSRIGYRVLTLSQNAAK